MHPVSFFTFYVTWIVGQPDYHRILGQDLVLVPTLGTYIEWHYINHFSANKFQHFEGTGRTLWSVLVPYDASEGFPSVPCEQGYFFSKKKTGVLINSGHKTAAAIDKSEKSNDGVFLPLFLYWLTCGDCWLSGGGLPSALAPRLSGGVCDFEWYWFWRSGAEDLSWLCWWATGPGRVRDIEEGGIQNCVC